MGNAVQRTDFFFSFSLARTVRLRVVAIGTSTATTAVTKPMTAAPNNFSADMLKAIIEDRVATRSAANTPLASTEPMTAPANAKIKTSARNINRICDFVPPTPISFATYLRLSLREVREMSTTNAIAMTNTPRPAMTTGADIEVD